MNVLGDAVNLRAFSFSGSLIDSQGVPQPGAPQSKRRRRLRLVGPAAKPIKNTLSQLISRDTRALPPCRYARAAVVCGAPGCGAPGETIAIGGRSCRDVLAVTPR